MKFQFPHFHRVNSARLFFGLEMMFLWISLATLITVNILALRTSRPAHWNELMKLFSSPFSVSRHIDLASLLWRQGQKKQARALMITAQSLSSPGQTTVTGGGGTVNVLGLTANPADTLAQWEHEAAQWEKQYSFWQSVSIAKPDYRDAFITLATLAYQLRNVREAKIWLTQAQALDPNNPTVQKLAQYVQEVQ